jgi:hypothetical protein
VKFTIALSDWLAHERCGESRAERNTTGGSSGFVDPEKKQYAKGSSSRMMTSVVINELKNGYSRSRHIGMLTADHGPVAQVVTARSISVTHSESSKS